MNYGLLKRETSPTTDDVSQRWHGRFTDEPWRLLLFHVISAGPSAADQSGSSHDATACNGIA